MPIPGCLACFPMSMLVEKKNSRPKVSLDPAEWFRHNWCNGIESWFTADQIDPCFET